MSAAPRLVVRTYAPLRRLLMVGGAVIGGLLALYISFEWGRSRAGFDGRDAREQRAALRDQIGSLEEEIKAQRLKIALYETEAVGQTRERTELARSIGDLQGQVARLTSDLEFYKGVVGSRDSTGQVKIQQFRVSSGPKQGEYLLRLVLGRPLRLENAISGKVKISIEGAAGTEPTTLDLQAVAGIAGGEIAFSYRYIETMEQPIQLPAGFVPARATVEVIPSLKGANPLRESFIWTVEN